MPSIAVKSGFIHVVAGLIRDVDDPQKIFLTRRKQGQHLENLWEFPGGKVEPGESRFQSLRRELLEETGIHVISAQPLQSVYHEYHDKSILLDVWEIKRYRGHVHGCEGQQSRWVDVSELDQLDFPAADMPVLKALKLPPELLVTPDMAEHHQSTYLEHFAWLMQKKAYPLVLFRSHHLDDDRYAEVAKELQQIGEPFQSEIIIHRPSLKSLQSSQFDKFSRRHLNSYLLQSLNENPFSENFKLSASCHDGAELTMARKLDCDFALLSTVRPTLSHPGRNAKGWFGFNRLARQSLLPLYALGGIQRRDFTTARFQGAIGVAGVSDFWTV